MNPLLPPIHPTGLGRIAATDARDHRAASVLRSLGVLPATTLPTSRAWWMPTTLPMNQGESPQCVAYASTGLLLASPVRNSAHLPTPDTIYFNAQRLDEIPGEQYDGTTARGAMKYLADQGYISRYVWAWDIATIEAWVLAVGPMLLGINWYSSFDWPTVTARQNWLRIAPTARIRGGHEVLVYAANRTQAKIGIMNSWGRSYGNNGRVWMPYETLDRLLQEDGDAVTPTEVLKR